jgi:hypothetical protein
VNFFVIMISYLIGLVTACVSIFFTSERFSGYHKGFEDGREWQKKADNPPF